MEKLIETAIERTKTGEDKFSRPFARQIYKHLLDRGAVKSGRLALVLGDFVTEFAESQSLICVQTTRLDDTPPWLEEEQGDLPSDKSN